MRAPCVNHASPQTRTDALSEASLLCVKQRLNKATQAASAATRFPHSRAAEPTKDAGVGGTRHSPWRGHLLLSTCYNGQSNTMNPPRKFAGRRTGDAAGRAGLEPEPGSRLWGGGGGARGRVHAASLSPGYQPQNNEKRLRLQTAVIPKWS